MIGIACPSSSMPHSRMNILNVTSSADNPRFPAVQLLPLQGTPLAMRSSLADQPAVDSLQWVVAAVMWCEHGRHLPLQASDSWLAAAETALRWLRSIQSEAATAADGAAVWALRFLQKLALHCSAAQKPSGSSSIFSSQASAQSWSKLWQVGLCFFFLTQPGEVKNFDAIYPQNFCTPA